MKRDKQIKIKLFRSEIGGTLDGFDATIENLVHIETGLIERRQQKLPASVVGDIAGVVESIAVFAERFLFSQVTQHPKLRKPGDVSDFPKRWVDGREPR